MVPRRLVRERLRLASELTVKGLDFVEALRINGLISRADAGVLTSSQRAGNLTWALRELAESGDRRLGYRIQALTQVLFIVSILSMGV